MIAQGQAAAAKLALARRPLRYLILAMLAGAYIGVGVVLMVSAAGPLASAGSGWTKLVSGLVFAVALTLVVFAGGELVTSNMMTLPQGVVMRQVHWRPALGALGFCFGANLLGAIAFAALVQASGVLRSNEAAGAMLDSMLASKAHYTNTELFFRAVLCNVLVCLAIWMCARVQNSTTKLMLIFWCIFAFITCGFEHVVANMTTFSLGLMRGSTSLGEAVRNLAVVGVGNLAGGCLLVALAYAGASGMLGRTAGLASGQAVETSPDAAHAQRAGVSERV